MAIRKTTGTLHLIRDGKKVVIKPGAIVDLTDSELKTIKRINPDAIEHPDDADVELYELRQNQQAQTAQSIPDNETPAQRKRREQEAAAAAAAAATGKGDDKSEDEDL